MMLLSNNAFFLTVSHTHRPAQNKLMNFYTRHLRPTVCVNEIREHTAVPVSEPRPPPDVAVIQMPLLAH